MTSLNSADGTSYFVDASSNPPRLLRRRVVNGIAHDETWQPHTQQWIPTLVFHQHLAAGTDHGFREVTAEQAHAFSSPGRTRPAKPTPANRPRSTRPSRPVHRSRIAIAIAAFLVAVALLFTPATLTNLSDPDIVTGGVGMWVFAGIAVAIAWSRKIPSN